MGQYVLKKGTVVKHGIIREAKTGKGYNVVAKGDIEIKSTHKLDRDKVYGVEDLLIDPLFINSTYSSLDSKNSKYYIRVTDILKQNKIKVPDPCMYMVAIQSLMFMGYVGFSIGNKQVLLVQNRDVIYG